MRDQVAAWDQEETQKLVELVISSSQKGNKKHVTKRDWKVIAEKLGNQHSAEVLPLRFFCSFVVNINKK